jgi:hypothetical protein
MAIIHNWMEDSVYPATTRLPEMIKAFYTFYYSPFLVLFATIFGW